MLKLIDTSSADYPVGFSHNRRLFKVASGPYAGRMAICYASDDSTVKLVYADPPYTNWSTPASIITDSADYPVSGIIDSGGNIYLAYTLESSHDLVMKKLSFSDGTWSAGSRNTIYDGDDNYYPSLFKDKYAKLWVSWTRVSGGVYYISTKKSTNDGVLWGLSDSDSGTDLVSGTTSAYSQLVYLPTYLLCVYTIDGTSLAYRKIETSAVVWYSEVELHSGTSLGKDFHAASSNDMKVGVAFSDDGDLSFKDYDNFAWSGTYSIDTDLSGSPVLKYNGSVPYIFFNKSAGSDQDQLQYSYRDGSSFSTAQAVEGGFSLLDKVLLYRRGATAPFNDRSTEAGDDTSGDIYHIDSGKLIKDSGDIIYLGQPEKFHQVRVTLFTNGAGGTVSWYYWDGSQWKSFTPLSGSYDFDSSPATLRLWQDSTQTPSDWQTTTVNGSGKFWIRVQVISDFATAPVGTQITGLAGIPQITILQE